MTHDLRSLVKVLLAFALLVQLAHCGGVLFAQEPVVVKGRPYHRIELTDVETTRWAHVSVVGFVQLVNRNDDGDVHINLVDSLTNPTIKVVVEQTPTTRVDVDLRACSASGQQDLARCRPRRGWKLRVWGIPRYDRGHRWPEVHPVEAWRRIE